MPMIDVVAIGAVSPLGLGDAAWSNGPHGAPASQRIARDGALAAAGLRRPFAARVPLASSGGEDRATTLLLAAIAQIEPALTAALTKGARLGLSLGSSSGGMESAERLFAALDSDAPAVSAQQLDAATYHAPFRAAVARLDARLDAGCPGLTRRAHLLSACSASTLAIGLAMAWLEADACDLVVAGGYDALTTFVAAGFEALGATTATCPPRPFRLGRDGMSLGEGAGVVLLRRAGSSLPRLARLLGAGASGDAVHLTAPDREGGGLSRAASQALDRAGIEPSTVDLVSVHGTSTPFNDPMEAKAIARALGQHGRDVAVHAAKASIGHTLGAAGVLETLLAIDALRRGMIPATAGEGELDPAVGAHPRARNEAATLRRVLKLSAAFGGANAALIVGGPDDDAPSVARPLREVHERARVEVGPALDLDRVAERSGVPRERLGRMDGAARAALAAVAELAHAVGRERLRGAGIVLGTTVATIDVNAVYAAAMRARGAGHAEGRRFVYTTPNAAAGECAIAFGLTGPNLAVGRGADASREAHEVARDLCARGDAERFVVVEVDADGPVARRQLAALGLDLPLGARATLLERD